MSDLVEERWMHERFGDAYGAYHARVPALVPSLRGGRGSAGRESHDAG